MKLKVRLLPHWCQIIGYSYWLIYFVICLMVMLVFTVFPDSGFAQVIEEISAPVLTDWKIIGIVNYCMLVLAVFSRDRVEDEVVMSLRIRSVVAIVILMFILHLAAYIAPEESLVGFIVNDTLLNNLLQDFGVLVILYLTIFKFSIVFNRWRSRYEE